MSRSIAIIEAEIVAIKEANANWMTNAGVMALIAALTNEKNACIIAQPAGKTPNQIISIT